VTFRACAVEDLGRYTLNFVARITKTNMIFLPE